MALSGDFTGSTNNDAIVPRIVWSAVQSVSENYSDVTATLYYSRTDSFGPTHGTWSGSITIDGQEFSGSTSIEISLDSNSFAMTAEARVYHNADGTKSITIIADGGVSGTSLSSTSFPGQSIDLDTIPRESTLSFQTNMTMDSPYTITINRASASFVHDIVLTWLEDSGNYIYIATKTSKASVSWTPPSASLGAAISTATSGRGTITVHTYTVSGSTYTLIGSHTHIVNLFIPSSIVPSISSFSVSIVNSNTVLKGWGIAVKNLSKFGWSSSASGAAGSTVKSWNVSFGSLSGIGASGTTGLISSSGTVTPAIKVTDSRGRISTKSSSAVSVYDYSNPVLSNVSANRYSKDASSNYVQSDSGTYVKITGSCTCTSLGGRNTATLQYRKRIAGGSWSSYTTFTTGEYISSVSASNTYYVEISALDTVGNRTAVVTTVPTESVTFHVRDGGTGIGIGKMAEADNLVDCGLPARYRKTIQADGFISNDLRVELNTNDYLSVSLHRSSSIKYLRCSAYPKQALTSGTEYSLGTLTTDYLPTQSVAAYVPVSYRSGPIFCRLGITIDGKVTLTPYADFTTSNGVNFYFSYI